MGKYKFSNRKFPPNFKRVADYIFKIKGVVVSLSHDTKFHGHFDRRITVHHNYDISKNGLFALLHECGHVFQPPTYVGVNSYKNLDKQTHLDEYRMGRFLNEVDAWNRGLGIARKLGIPIDMFQLEQERNKALITYFN